MDDNLINMLAGQQMVRGIGNEAVFKGKGVAPDACNCVLDLGALAFMHARLLNACTADKHAHSQSLLDMHSAYLSPPLPQHPHTPNTPPH